MPSSSSRRPPAEHVTILANCDIERPHVRKLIKSYQALGVNVSLAGWDRLAQMPAMSRQDGISIDYIQRGWGYANKWLALGIPLWLLRATWHLVRRRPELVHAIDMDDALPAAIASIVTGRPFIYDIRDNFALRYNWPPGVAPVIRAVDAWVKRRASGIIIVDDTRFDSALDRLREKVRILYNTPDDVPPPSGAQSERPFTVYASGYLSSGRGIGMLLDAVESLPEARVILAGRFHDPALEARAMAHPQVSYRGWLPQEDSLRLCYQADAVFSFYDPSVPINRVAASNKWFDAMMTGRPIVANSEVAKAGWIEEKGIGFVCAYDAAALADLLKRLAVDPSLPEVGLRGRRLYEAEYNWPAMQRRLEELVRRGSEAPR